MEKLMILGITFLVPVCQKSPSAGYGLKKRTNTIEVDQVRYKLICFCSNYQVFQTMRISQ
jgi:hypothetical protein